MSRGLTISLYVFVVLLFAMMLSERKTYNTTIVELERKLIEQQADNENLRFQYNQCKILYRGM